MDYFITAVGLLLVLEGLPYFAFPEKVRLYLQKIQEMPDSSLRMFGLIFVLLGLGLVYVGQMFMRG